MNKKSYIIFFLVFIFSIFFLSSNSYAGTQKWNALDYDVTVNDDGSMDVVETWDIYISKTNTLFKTFNIDSSKYSSIDNVEIIEINPERRELTQISEQQYHVDSGCFYALKIDSKTFEIAWNVGLDYGEENRTYEVHYKVNDVVKVYNDCTELYWMFLSDENAISGKNITGKIKLPNKVENLEDLRVWGHGDLNAEIYKESNNTVIFKSDSLASNTMLEVRVVTEENIYPQIINKKKINKLDSILREEKKWADIANFKRVLPKIITVALAGLYIFLFVWFFIKIIKYIKDGKRLKHEYSEVKFDSRYFRDIPNENDATPGRAGYLYYMSANKSKFSYNIGNVISATMLNLALKDFIKFEPIDRKNMKIILNNNLNREILLQDEVKVLEIIETACENKAEITTDELRKYSRKHYETIYSKINSLESNVISELRKKDVIDFEKEKIFKEYESKRSKYILFSFLGIEFIILLIGFPILIELIICAILCNSNAKKISILSESGEEERAQWKALKNYMNEFSLLKEKEVPDLILWEKYLVYATAFGISKNVIKDLKLVYPEMRDPNYYNNTSCHYIHYLSDSRFENDFVTSFSDAISSACSSASSAYSAVHSPSSSGSGGGRRFLKWWWRPEAAVAGCGGR